MFCSHSFDHIEHAANSQRERIERAAGRGVVWLLELQNEDGGWATFYRDDSLLRRDESGTDVTAQALRALAAWRRDWRTDTSSEAKRRWSFIDERAVASDREWMEISRVAPTGRRQLHPVVVRQRASSQTKRIRSYGTAQVLFASAELDRLEYKRVAARRPLAAGRAAFERRLGTAPHSRSITRAQKRTTREPGAKTTRWPSSARVEETSLAISALIPLADSNPAVSQAVSRGLTWLTAAVEQDAHRRPAIIGFSLAKLWYHERLYPLAFAAGALSRAVRSVGVETPAASHVG